MTFDPTKSVKTKDGRKVEIIVHGLDVDSVFTIYAKVWPYNEDEKPSIKTYTADGCFLVTEKKAYGIW